MSFEASVSQLRQRVASVLHEEVGKRLPPGQLGHAMQIAIATPGKYIRPLLCYAAADCLGLARGLADMPAVAIELVHTYSLIHDDLPAMDDDDLRRGQPTLHKQFDEATAILAGDALLTLAFEVLAAAPDATDELKIEWVKLLARAAGGQGMVQGQMMDLLGENQTLALDDLTQMHQDKSGRLLAVGLAMMTAASSIKEETCQQLLDFGLHIGLAFQVRDDILDDESTTEVLGKPAGSDAAQGKSTFTSLLGLEGAKQQLAASQAAAKSCLAAVPLDTEPLEWMADYIVGRSH